MKHTYVYFYCISWQINELNIKNIPRQFPQCISCRGCKLKMLIFAFLGLWLIFMVSLVAHTLTHIHEGRLPLLPILLGILLAGRRISRVLTPVAWACVVNSIGLCVLCWPCLLAGPLCWLACADCGLRKFY